MQRSEVANKYVGQVAAEYFKRRSEREKWQAEHRAVQELLQHVPEGAKIIDVPIGTGRFLELYRARGLRVTGIDISTDMLDEARSNVTRLELKSELTTGSIFELAFPENSFDCALCVRMLNWFEIGDVKLAIGELSRVSSKYVIVSVRTYAEHMGLSELIGSMLDLWVRGLNFGKRKRVRTTIFSRADILAVFSAENLKIVKSEIVPSRPRGTRFEFFLLQKGND